MKFKFPVHLLLMKLIPASVAVHQVKNYHVSTLAEASPVLSFAGPSAIKVPFTSYIDQKRIFDRPGNSATPSEASSSTQLVPSEQTTSSTSKPNVIPFADLNKRYQQYISGTLANSSRKCSAKNVRHRRSWAKLSDDDRKSYLNSVHCLHNGISSKFTQVPGAKFRADDLTTHHIISGGIYVFTGFMLPFHRWMIQVYEDMLRDECDYKGAIPFWDFSEHTGDITKDPIFSGNSTSMGGNGAPVPRGHGWVELDYLSGKKSVPPGSGGSCLFNPPFRTITYEGGVTSWDAISFRDRCLTRDLNTWAGQLLNIAHVEYDLSCTNIGCLQERLNGAQPGYPYLLNLMNSVRFSVGGLQLDPFAAPTDPIYYLAAANIDRLWAIWQAQEPNVRVNQTGGTHRPMGMGGAVKPSDIMIMLTPGTLRPVSDFSSTIDGTLCYCYE
ncbi:Di-copper centre-containing protein [Lindgomyces ingoldianus]|uniref:Di-copper centre-containing protein n=1 Tax=Lindgomyces ingoldianus TaxID=673940 RepID=A0ACB6QFG3_9PLEO|nr:Di-copper centre-containing protein [Lindgomyces ingoldianus]KAF2465323.1 Di-copper centre-containing protein [Lindgomyces ingoldianus]